MLVCNVISCCSNALSQVNFHLLVCNVMSLVFVYIVIGDCWYACMLCLKFAFQIHYHWWSFIYLYAVLSLLFSITLSLVNVHMLVCNDTSLLSMYIVTVERSYACKQCHKFTYHMHCHCERSYHYWQCHKFAIVYIVTGERSYACMQYIKFAVRIHCHWWTFICLYVMS
jgi:hypothetical protein